MSADAHAAPIAVEVVEDLRTCPCCGQPRPTGRLFDAAVRVAAERYDTSLREIRSDFRSDRLVTARALVVWAHRALGRGVSYAAIGRLIHRTDHSTIINLHKKALRLRLEDERFAAACTAIAFNLRDTEEI